MSKQEWGYYATPEKTPLDFLMSNLIQSKIKVYIPMCGSTYFEFLVCINIFTHKLQYDELLYSST